MHLCRIKSASIIYQCISKTKAQIIFATRAWQVPLIIRLSLELNAMLWIQTRSDVSREADESPATRPSAVTTRVCAALLSLTRSASLTPVCAICRRRFVHPSRPVQSDRWRIFVLEWERMTTANWKWLMCVFVLSESKALRADVITHAPPAGRGRAMIIFWTAFELFCFPNMFLFRLVEREHWKHTFMCFIVWHYLFASADSNYNILLFQN